MFSTGRTSPVIVAWCTSICIMAMPAGAAKCQQPAWTTRDLDQVASAAIEAAAASDVRDARAMMLLDLADALIRAGNFERAKYVILRAGETLGSSDEVARSTWAPRIVEKLAGLGDFPDAESIATAAIGDDKRALLLVKIGEARARAGDITGAIKTAEWVTSLGDVTPNSVPAVTNAKAMALVGIGAALNDEGAVDVALKMADALPDGSWKINLLSRIGMKLCEKDAPAQVARGQVVTEQAVHIILTAPTENLQPYEKRDWVVSAAGALGTCEGANVVVALLQRVLPAEQIALASIMIADNFAREGKADLVRALAPPANPDDVDSLLDAAKRSMQVGDLATAKAQAIRASNTALYRSNSTPD
jgi:hypothetical protein